MKSELCCELHHHLRIPAQLGLNTQLEQIPAFQDGNRFSPKRWRCIGPSAASQNPLSTSAGSHVLTAQQPPHWNLSTYPPARNPASASRTAHPVVTATREVLTPNPARPRPSRSPSQHGVRQPGSGAAAARRALGAAGRRPGLARCCRPASACLPRPASLRRSSRTAASAPLS